MMPTTFVKVSFWSYLAEGNANTHEGDIVGPKMTLVCLSVFVLRIMEPPPRHPKSYITGDYIEAVTLVSVVIDITTKNHDLMTTIIIDHHSHHDYDHHHCHRYLLVNIWLAISLISWWRHQMESFSALVALCAWNSPVSGEFPAQSPATRSFNVFFDLRLNKIIFVRWSVEIMGQS